MSLLDKLSDPAVWAEFREYKSFRSHLSNREFRLLDEFIAQKRYLAVTSRINNADHGFAPPRRRVKNLKKQEKRVRLLMN